jgi:hypothetical protein
VLPALIDRLETVTVGIKDVPSVITGIVIQARAGLAVVSRAGCHCCVIERVHLSLTLGDKADMRSPAIRIALPKPEEYATIPSEALEVGMPFRTILAVVIDGMHDAERFESHLVEGNRSIQILDGYEDVVEQEFTSLFSRFLPSRATTSSTTKSNRHQGELTRALYSHTDAGAVKRGDWLIANRAESVRG